MGINCGIVGLPNVGKSTLFNAITRASVPAANYPFCTIDPNIGVVQVPDPRLDKLAELVTTQQLVPTVMQFVDIAGLVAGASKGEGLGNKFLGHIAEVDAVAHVVRCFEDDEVIHVSNSIDPARDIEVIDTELALRDLSIVNSTMSRFEKLAKSGDKKAPAAIEILKAVASPLNNGVAVRATMKTLAPEAWDVVKPLNLLTAKPTLYVANIAESDIAKEENGYVKKVREIAKAEGSGVVVICASVEAQIATLETEEERREFLAAVGLKEPGLDKLIRASYELLGLITYFTVGPEENRAWTVRRGSTAPQAAGVIHTDFERGFIRAEVIGYDDFIACKSEAVARERGKLRVEGKEYILHYGDLMHFRFSV